MSLITYSGGTLEPDLVLGYSTAREGGAIVHDILGRADPDVTLRPMGTRTGTLTLLFTAEADAEEAERVLASADTFALSDPDRSSILMDFASTGTVTRTLDPDTLDVWIVTVAYRQVVL